MKDVVDISSLDRIEYIGDEAGSIITILTMEREQKLNYIDKNVLGIEKDIGKAIVNLYYNVLFDMRLPDYINYKKKLKKEIEKEFDINPNDKRYTFDYSTYMYKKRNK